MQAADERARHAAARMWAMLSTLDSDVTKNMRPARAGIYDEDYPLPMLVAEVVGGGSSYTLPFCVYDWTDPTTDDHSQFRVAYYPEDPEECAEAEWAILQGSAAGTQFQFHYYFLDRIWHEYGYSSGDQHPVDPARVCQVLRDFADTTTHGLRHACFDNEILNAVSALPLPIAEQVAWYLAPPTLEDSLLRRGLTSP